MLIPRFSIKILLIVTTIAAVFSYVLSQALKGGLEGIFVNNNFINRQQMTGVPVSMVPAAERGEAWAVAVMMGLIAIILVMFLFTLFWSLAWAWDQTVGQLLKPVAVQGGNPFASAGPPRQIVPPTEPQ